VRKSKPRAGAGALLGAFCLCSQWQAASLSAAEL